ncbi:unnamed protein product [Eruca vesicaria subsp. sativa]|uniref:Uncharacterized protein n=1 Tax=Eruca vesicaria subsp. sativa TaxID=29727 RepID=A0ABC8JRB4_ERUVS|nr:unnamed protein product [Eruca vesicaria subsp. sativa]
MAIADVTIDACIAHKSNTHPSLTSDMQSLGSYSSSIGALLGFFMSGILVHLVGSKGVFGLLTFPFPVVSVVGIVFSESRVTGFSYKQVNQKFIDAGKAVWRTMKCPYLQRMVLWLLRKRLVSFSQLVQ